MDTIIAEIFADAGSIFMGMSYIQDYNLNTLSVVSDNSIDNVDIKIAGLSAFWNDIK